MNFIFLGPSKSIDRWTCVSFGAGEAVILFSVLSFRWPSAAVSDALWNSFAAPVSPALCPRRSSCVRCPPGSCPVSRARKTRWTPSPSNRYRRTARTLRRRLTPSKGRRTFWSLRMCRPSWKLWPKRRPCLWFWLKQTYVQWSLQCMRGGGARLYDGTI